MLTTIGALFLVATTAPFAVAEPAPRPLAFMSVNDAFGLVKRQGGGGYYPSVPSSCSGPGTTCREVCGEPFVEECNSPTNPTCFDPTKSHCCPDGSGRKCLFVSD